MCAEDRRQHPRADFPQIRLRFGRGPDLEEEVLHDLSVGGFFVTTDRTLPVGSEMEVHLELVESGQDYHLLGRVARIQLGEDASANGMAVEFLELPREAERGLGEAVESFQERAAASLEPAVESEEAGDDPAIRQFQDRVRQLRKELMLSDERAAEGSADLDATRSEADELRDQLQAERQKSQELAAQVERVRGELVEVKGLIGANQELEGRVRALTNEVLDAREELVTARQRLSELESRAAEAGGSEEFEVTVLEAEPVAAGDQAPGEGLERALDPTEEEASEPAQQLPPAEAATAETTSGEETARACAVEGEEAAAEDREPAPEESAAAELERSIGPEVVTDLGDFVERLEGGVRLRTTARFQRLEPVSREDIQVSDWLREADNLKAIQGLAQGRLPEERLHEVLYLFFERGLVRILE